MIDVNNKKIYIFALIKSAIKEEKIETHVLEQLSEEKLISIYNVAKAHDIAQIIASTIIKNKVDISDNFRMLLNQEISKAIYRYKNHEYEIKKIQELFDKEKIPYIILKGSIIREYYNTPWYRSSCDIDILVQKEYIEKALDKLQNIMLYKINNRNAYEIELINDNDIVLELHFKLFAETYSMKELESPLEDIFTKCDLKKNTYEYVMPYKYIYYYNAAHMVTHFLAGGCGIKPFIDLYFLEKKKSNVDEIDQILKSGMIYTFNEKAKRLIDIWFEQGEYDEDLINIEKYIIMGGVYGNAINRGKIRRVQSGSIYEYIKERTFIPTDDLMNIYPSLKKHRKLEIFYQAKRWVDLIFKKKKRNFVTEVKKGVFLNKKEKENTIGMLRYMGIDNYMT